MKITKPDDVLFLQGYMQKSGRNFFVATVGYVLEKDGTLVPEAEAWAWLLKYFPDEPFDAGLKKNRGTFAVAGNAYAPHGTPVRQMAVRASVGDVQKTLHVQGDRQWQRGVLGWKASEPAPFTEMPIDLAHAFGGAQHPENPFGRGWWANADDAEGQPLPNLELPNRPVTRPDDDAPVATLGNLYVGAASRARMLGTFDTQWQATRFPGLPDDHDPRWFDAVPQDQCIPEYWRGDESWSVSGMHAQRETVQGTLPGLHPEMVFQRSAASPWTEDTPASGPEQAHFELDTVWLFPNEERVMLLYRTSIAVQREDAADIAAAGIFTAGVDELPMDVPQLTEKWLESDFSVLDYLPEALGVISALAGAAALAAKVKDHYDSKKKKKEEKERKEQAARQAQATLATPTEPPVQPQSSPAPATAAAAAPATSATPTLTPAPTSSIPAQSAAPAASQPGPAPTGEQPADGVPATSAAVQGSQTGDAWADEVWQDMTRRYNESWEEGRRLLHVLEEDNEGHLPFPLGDPGPFTPPPAPVLDSSPPGAPPDDLATIIDARIEAALEEGRQLFEQAIRDAVSEHPELMDQLLANLNSPAPGPIPTLDQMEQILQDMPQDVRERAESELLELEARFNELRQEIDATFNEGGSTNGSDGPGGVPPTVARPTMAQDTGVDPGTGTVDGDGDGTDTGDGDGDGTDTGDGDSVGSDDALPEKTPGGSVGVGPGRHPASGSAPENATPTLPPPLPLPEPILLADQNLRAADLRGADYRGAVLQNCDFSGADLSGANLSGAALQGCNLNGANLDGADLERADVRDVDMRRASLSNARADHATFTDTDLSGANLADARLSRASFDDCRLDGARLDRATLENATLSGVQGDKVSFTSVQAQGLRLDSGTQLSKADFSNARLENASIQDSFLTNADLSNADMTASFFRASDLSGSTAQAAQAVDAAFKDVRLADASWNQANLMQASFDNTLLHNVDLSGSNLYATQTRIADVRGIRVQNSLLDSSQLLKEAHGA